MCHQWTGYVYSVIQNSMLLASNGPGGGGGARAAKGQGGGCFSANSLFFLWAVTF